MWRSNCQRGTQIYLSRARLKALGYQVPLITRISARVCFMFLVGANRETDSLFYIPMIVMPTREENSVEAKKSSYTEEDLKDAYQKGRRVGQVEGMIAYQKRLVENLQKDNASLTKKLSEVVK